jgi:hypothetical protein
LVFALGAAQSRPERTGVAAFQEAQQRLAGEARQSHDARQLVRGSASFASDFKQAVPALIINQRIVRPQHEDPFIDAYVRWQLTGFPGVQLPELSDRQFEALLEDLPAMVSNPRGDRALVDAVARAARAGNLTAQQQQSLNAELNDLADRASRAAALNRPALELRTWLRKQAAPSKSRSLMAGLEHCASVVEAGWPADEAKARLDADFAAARRDRKFTDAQRRIVAERARALAGKRTLLISSAAIRDNALIADFADTGIYDFDVRRWEKSLNRE